MQIGYKTTAYDGCIKYIIYFFVENMKMQKMRYVSNFQHTKWTHSRSLIEQQGKNLSFPPQYITIHIPDFYLMISGYLAVPMDELAKLYI